MFGTFSTYQHQYHKTNSTHHVSSVHHCTIQKNPRWGFQGTVRQGPRRTWNPPRWDSSQRYATPQSTNSGTRKHGFDMIWRIQYMYTHSILAIRELKAQLGDSLLQHHTKPPSIIRNHPYPFLNRLFVNSVVGFCWTELTNKKNIPKAKGTNRIFLNPRYHVVSWHLPGAGELEKASEPKIDPKRW